MFAYCYNDPTGAIDSEGKRPFQNGLVPDNGHMPDATRALIRSWETKWFYANLEKQNNYVDKPDVNIIKPTISTKGFKGGVCCAASRTHLTEGPLSLDVDILKADASLEISYDHFNGDVGAYLVDTSWTIDVFGISLSVGGNIGVGAHFKSTETGVSFGASAGVGLTISLDWGAFHESSTITAEDYEREAD